MKRTSKRDGKGQAPAGPSQRQLRAGELIRHALVEILREEEIHDEALQGVSVTLTEVRMSPDLRHATCFIEPLGAAVSGTGLDEAHIRQIVEAMNRHARFLRGILGRHIDMKFTPDLRFIHDESFGTAAYMDALFAKPEVQRDLRSDDEDLAEDEDDQ
ncbi:MAG: 30S ribosome-binding factor RbfA [Asticcacaulis sp.]